MMIDAIIITFCANQGVIDAMGAFGESGVNWLKERMTGRVRPCQVSFY